MPREGDKEKGDASASAPGSKGLFGWSGRTWVGVIAGTTLLAHLLLLSLFGFRRGSADQPLAEVSLGDYQFVNPERKASTPGASFALHLNLLNEVDAIARRQLASRRYRVQQAVEELLRQAHIGDFADPTLSELKRQLQETINATLEMRAIQDVIITDLTFDHSPQAGPTSTAPPAQANTTHMLDRALAEPTAPGAPDSSQKAG